DGVPARGARGQSTSTYRQRRRARLPGRSHRFVPSSTHLYPWILTKRYVLVLWIAALIIPDVRTKHQTGVIPMGKLDGKVAVVTGASKGIGASIALHLAAEGASVVVNYSSSKQGADRVVSEISSKGGKALAVRANLSDPADIPRLFAKSKEAFGKLDI